MTTHHEVLASWRFDDGLLAPTTASHQVAVQVSRLDCYDILIAAGLLGGRNPLVEQRLRAGAESAWIVTDEIVADLHGERLSLLNFGGSWVRDTLVLPPGETTKSQEGWTRCIDWMTRKQVGRRDAVLAVGGSVVSDLVGFAAATYMRGIAYVNVPTTLLSQVDGAMGGKVAINTPHAKNLVGAFHHPTMVVTDTEFLQTLERAEIANGLAEAIKTFAIESSDAFAFLEETVADCLDGRLERLTAVVRLCAEIKMHLLDNDPYEVDLRRVLNFGHTLGHPIETSFAYEGIRHGEAVAIGMASAARIGHRRGLTTDKTLERLVGLLTAAELPTSIDRSAVDEVIERVEIISAIRGGSLRFVIPTHLGERMMIVDDVTTAEMTDALVGS